MTMTNRFLAFAGALLLACSIGLMGVALPSFAYASQDAQDYSAQDVEHKEAENNSASTQYYLDGSGLQKETSEVVPVPAPEPEEPQKDVFGGLFPKTGDFAFASLFASIALIALGTMFVARGLKDLRKTQDES